MSNNEFWETIIKVFTIFVSFGVALGFSYSPMKCNLRRKLKNTLNILNSLNGGIMIGVGLFILLPHANKNFKLYFEEPAESMEKDVHSAWEEMPYAFYITFLSYAMLLFIEKIAFTKMMTPQNPANIDDSVSMTDSFTSQVESDDDEEIVKDAISNKGRLASFLQTRKCNNKLI